jgi:hypothetical protein
MAQTHHSPLIPSHPHEVHMLEHPELLARTRNAALMHCDFISHTDLFLKQVLIVPCILKINKLRRFLCWARTQESNFNISCVSRERGRSIGGELILALAAFFARIHSVSKEIPQ